MNADRLSACTREFYQSFTVNIPQVDIIDGQAVFTWHFTPRPSSAENIFRTHDHNATRQAIAESLNHDQV